MDTPTLTLKSIPLVRIDVESTRGHEGVHVVRCTEQRPKRELPVHAASNGNHRVNVQPCNNVRTWPVSRLPVTKSYYYSMSTHVMTCTFVVRSRMKGTLHACTHIVRYTHLARQTQSYEFVEVTSDDNGDDDKQRGDKRQKTKKLASRSKAARDFGTAWRAGMAAVVPRYRSTWTRGGRKDDCGEITNLVLM